MIRINKYKVCRITGETDVDVTLFTPSEQTLEKRFESESDAIAWIEAEQSAELAMSMISWINHKVHISLHSDWYKFSERKDALAQLQPLVNEIIKYSLHSAVVEVLNHRDLLYKILPAPGNKSFEASKARLDEIMAFCNRKVKQMQLKKIS